MSVVFEKTKLLTDKQFHYCPGCNHGIIHRLVAESIDELVQEGKLEAGRAGPGRQAGSRQRHGRGPGRMLGICL